MDNSKLHPVNNPSPQASFPLLNFLVVVFIFSGIAFFISSHWSSLSNIAKIFSTLGSAITAFIFGIGLHLRKKNEIVSSAFFMVSGCLLPIGLFLMFKTYDMAWAVDKTDLIITAICLCTFLLGDVYSPRTIFVIFNIIFASLFFMSIIDFLMAQSDILIPNLFEYEIMILALSYIFLGRYLAADTTYPLTGLLYVIGVSTILCTSYYLGGSFTFNSNTSHWRLITGILIFLTFLSALPLRSKVFLFLGSLFLIVYVTDLSSQFERFFGDFGLAMMLTVVGFSVLALGYFILFIHRKITHF